MTMIISWKCARARYISVGHWGRRLYYAPPTGRRYILKLRKIFHLEVFTPSPAWSTGRNLARRNHRLFNARFHPIGATCHHRCRNKKTLSLVSNYTGVTTRSAVTNGFSVLHGNGSVIGLW